MKAIHRFFLASILVILILLAGVLTPPETRATLSVPTTECNYTAEVLEIYDIDGEEHARILLSNNTETEGPVDGHFFCKTHTTLIVRTDGGSIVALDITF